jgi:flagellar hook-length control protein FliK
LSDAPAPPPTPVDQIVRTARILRQEGGTELRMRLEPPTLGWVRVSVRATEDALSLAIDAERPETRSLLIQTLPDLRQALAIRGLDVASVAIRVDPELTGARSDQARPSERSRRTEPHERVRARSGGAAPLPRVDFTI